MSSNWPTVKLGDYCKKIGSGATPRGGASVYLDEGEICLIRSQNVYNEGFNPNGLVYIDEEAAKKLKNVTVEENDVLLNITGDSVARVCLAKSNFLPARVNQHVAIIRPDEKEFDSRFIRYLLASPAYQNILLSIAAVGATRNALTKGMIENLDVVKPPIEQQIEIADKLEALEKKIDINSETNQTLEQIAQALFKSWFVDFDPVKEKIVVLEAGGTAEEAELAAMRVIAAKSSEQLTELKQSKPDAFDQLAQTAALFPSAMQESELGKIPEGWEVGLLSSEIEVLNGFAFKSKDYVKKGTFVLRTKNFDNGTATRLQDDVFLPESFLESHKKYLCQPFDYHLVMVGASVGNRGMLYPDLLPALRNQNMWCFRPKQASDISRPQVKFILDTLIAKTSGLASGSAREFFRKGDFQNQTICFGSKEIRKLFAEKTTPIFEELSSLIAEQRLLGEMRDALLPELLSGKLGRV